jgi:phosphatidylglycerol:prolipoprotein diacylglycerol transferase
MHPYLVTIGGKSFPAYPLIYGLGIAVGGIVVLLLGRLRGLSSRKLAHVFLLFSFAVFIGGRAGFVMQHSEAFGDSREDAFDLSEGGQVLYGGLLLAIPVLVLSIRLLRLPFGETADLFAVASPIGLAVGRWACFCRGCCYGKISDVAWAIRYPRHVDLAGHLVGPPAFLDQVQRGVLSETADCTLPVHPVPIYESLASLVMFFVMLWLWRTKRLSGRLIIAYPVLYAVARFGLDFTREYKMAFWGLTVSQVVSVMVFAAGVGLLTAAHYLSARTADKSASPTGQ